MGHYDDPQNGIDRMVRIGRILSLTCLPLRERDRPSMHGGSLDLGLGKCWTRAGPPYGTVCVRSITHLEHGNEGSLS